LILKKKDSNWKRDKYIRDVIIHIYEWQELFLISVNINQKNIEKQFLIDGYNCKIIANMNIKFEEKHKNTSYDKELKLLKKIILKL